MLPLVAQEELGTHWSPKLVKVDTVISLAGSAPKVRCSPEFGGAPRRSGCFHSNGDGHGTQRGTTGQRQRTLILGLMGSHAPDVIRDESLQ